MDKKKDDQIELFINRELSLLQFTFRVLAQAEDESIPLLERLHFLFITSSNLDEFFEIRVAALKQKATFQKKTASPDGLTASESLKQIRIVAHQLSDAMYQTFNKQLLPALKQEHIHFLKFSALNEEQTTWLKRYFRHDVLPVLTPIGLDLTHPFPRLVNKSLNFIVSLEGKDAFGRDSGLAIIHASRALARVIKLPEEISSKGDRFIFLYEIIRAFADDLFPGMSISGCYQFRLTRNSDLFVDEEQTEDLLHAIKGELLTRRYGDAVRLEVEIDCPEKIALFLLKKFKLSEDDLYQVAGPVNLNRSIIVLHLLNRPDLCYPKLEPGLPKDLPKITDMFSSIKQHDIMLHHPFQSFTPVLNFIRQAARDPDVLAIKQTIYRTDTHSDMIDALAEAARAGKEVTAVVELRARFDEEENINIANRLQKDGALVVYGVVGYKTHAKMSLVVRKEGKKLQRYVHLGTGNYHETLARQYCDISFFTADKEVTLDIHMLFQQLTGMGRASRMKKILHAPFTLHKTLLKLIEQEIESAKAGKPAQIIAKINSLTEPKIIQALYDASSAGVKIDLIVRGICCLRPGIAGLSENIRVRSIVDRFLEHARIYYFENAGEAKIYCASADWMERNFFTRVELCFPIDDKALAERLKKEGLRAYLQDNSQSWLLQKDGSYKRLQPPTEEKRRSAQEYLLNKLGNGD